MKEIVFLLLAIAAPSAMADTRCSDATGHVTYLGTGYNKGIPPRDGDELSTIQVSLDGKLVSKSIAYQGKPAELGPINPDFSSITMLKQEAYRKDFSALLTLSPNRQSRVVALAEPEQAYVICHEEFFAVP